MVSFLGFKVNIIQKKKIIYLCKAYNGFSIKMHLDILLNITNKQLHSTQRITSGVEIEKFVAHYVAKLVKSCH